MRRKIPPTKEMFDIDQHNLKTFGFRNGKAVFLLPNHIKRTQQGVKAAAIRKKNEVVEYKDKNKWLRSKMGAHAQGTVPGTAPPGASNSRGASASGDQGDDEDEGEDGDQFDDGEGGEDNDEEEEEEEEEEDQGVTRARSKSIRPPNGQTPPVNAPPLDAEHVVRKKKGVLNWLFGKKPLDPAKEAARREKKEKREREGGFSLFGIFKKKEEKEEVDESAEMWSSTQCFYTYNILSRQARMQLVLRCSKLEALDGERTNYMLFNTKPKYLSTYYALKKLLTKDCARLVVPPVSMKDLSSRPFLEVQALFTSQVKICRKLDDMEHMLYNKISKYDNFLPFITCAPVFTRDLGSFDNALLNSEQLILNISNEEVLERHNAKKKQQGAPAGTDVAAAAVPVLDDKKSQFAYDSVSSAHASSVGHASGITSKAEVAKQKAEEAEEVAVGKVTLSLSQCLDGSNYLRNSQQGSRDMLESYLADDECMMVWHLPVVPSQPLQVVLIWRDHSASLHSKYSSSSPKDLDELLPAGQKKKKKSGKPPRNPNDATSTGEPHKKGVVMEIAKSDLETSHILQYLQVRIYPNPAKLLQ